ncbi:MAG: hypothetical protein SGARI_007672 [Bacillariaceae sp.]
MRSGPFAFPRLATRPLTFPRRMSLCKFPVTLEVAVKKRRDLVEFYGQNTQEMFYSAKRQQYLIDQGYTFKIVTNLSDKAAEDAVKHNYVYNSPEADRKLLRVVLNSETDLDKEQRSEDAAIRKSNPDAAALADSGTKRNAGMDMSKVSGGSGLQYKEIKSSKTHPLFRKRQRR